jgi:hypothetical protein
METPDNSLLLGTVMAFLDAWDHSPHARGFAESSLVKLGVDELREAAFAEAQRAQIHWPEDVARP